MLASCSVATEVVLTTEQQHSGMHTIQSSNTYFCNFLLLHLDIRFMYFSYSPYIHTFATKRKEKENFCSLAYTVLQYSKESQFLFPLYFVYQLGSSTLLLSRSE